MLCNSLGAFSTRSICTSASILPWAISLQPSLKANGDSSKHSRPMFTKHHGICVQPQGGSTNFVHMEGIEIVLYDELFAHHEWQAKLEDLAVETLIPKEDLEIVLSALFVDADIFLTKDEKLIRKSFSLPLEPNVPAFCTPEHFVLTLVDLEQGFKRYPES